MTASDDMASEQAPVGGNGIDNRRQDLSLALIGRWLFGGGLAGLGAIGIIYGDFALQWQPVPDGLPGRTMLAYISGAILLVAGLSLFFHRSIRVAVSVLAVLLSVWTVLLHLPRVAVQPLDVSRWLGLCEILALASAAIILAASQPGIVPPGEDRRRSAICRIALRCFGASLLIFGLAHFVYADFTAAMVPAWIPARLFWAYFTGCAHIAAGIAILGGIKARLGATMLGVMFASWVIILHAPRVAADPASRIEWTMLVIATALTGAAWIVAGEVSRMKALRST